MKHHTMDYDCKDVREACESYGGVVKFWLSTFPQVLPEMYDIFKDFKETEEFKAFY
jgi:Ribonuclease 2-5A